MRLYPQAGQWPAVSLLCRDLRCKWRRSGNMAVTRQNNRTKSVGYQLNVVVGSFIQRIKYPGEEHTIHAQSENHPIAAVIHSTSDMVVTILNSWGRITL